GHDGSLSYSARLTPIRVVCQNTLTAATASKALITLRHTTTIESRAKLVRTMIERFIGALHETGDTFAKLAHATMNVQDVADYIDRVFPNDDPAGKVSTILRNKRDAVARLVFHGKGAELAGATRSAATAWAVYNAVTEYIDHVRPAIATSAASTQ